MKYGIFDLNRFSYVAHIIANENATHFVISPFCGLVIAHNILLFYNFITLK